MVSILWSRWVPPSFYTQAKPVKLPLTKHGQKTPKNLVGFI